jgi:hypothetical protein
MLTRMEIKKESEKTAIIIHRLVALNTAKCGTLNHAQTKISPNQLCGPIEMAMEMIAEKTKK